MKEKVEFENNQKPYVFRYRQDNDNTLSEILESYIYFPTHEKLNDPFDANYKLINIPKENEEIIKLAKIISTKFDNTVNKQYFEKFYLNNPTSFYDFIIESIESFFSKFGIACFTISPVNLMLWATYANNHQGLCIQYNTNYDEKFFEDIRLIEYVSKFQKIDYSPENEHESMMNLFFKKLEIWRNEYELRLIKDQYGRHKINSNAIRSIAFGLRATEEFKNKVINIIKSKHNHIILYESKILEDSYGLSFTQIIL